MVALVALRRGHARPGRRLWTTWPCFDSETCIGSTAAPDLLRAEPRAAEIASCKTLGGKHKAKAATSARDVDIAAMPLPRPRTHVAALRLAPPKGAISRHGSCSGNSATGRSRGSNDSVVREHPRWDVASLRMTGVDRPLDGESPSVRGRRGVRHEPDEAFVGPKLQPGSPRRLSINPTVARHLPYTLRACQGAARDGRAVICATAFR